MFQMVQHESMARGTLHLYAIRPYQLVSYIVFNHDDGAAQEHGQGRGLRPVQAHTFHEHLYCV